MPQVTLSQLIKSMQEDLHDHGDVPVYCYQKPGMVTEVESLNDGVYKIYHTKSGGLSYRELTVPDDQLYDADLTKPITKGFV